MLPSIPWRPISSNQQPPAHSHCPPFTHAEIAALYVMLSHFIPWRPVSNSSPSPGTHCPPISNAEIAALYVMASRSIPWRNISSRSSSARCDSAKSIKMTPATPSPRHSWPLCQPPRLKSERAFALLCISSSSPSQHPPFETLSILRVRSRHPSASRHSPLPSL